MSLSEQIPWPAAVLSGAETSPEKARGGVPDDAFHDLYLISGNYTPGYPGRVRTANTDHRRLGFLRLLFSLLANNALHVR